MKQSTHHAPLGTVILISLLINIPLICMVLIPYIWSYVFMTFITVAVLSLPVLLFVKNDSAAAVTAAKESTVISLGTYVLLCLGALFRGEGPVNFPGLLFLGLFIVPAIFLICIGLARLLAPRAPHSSV